MSGLTGSTTNYLWSLQDVLGQGATASVYKARNKVGHVEDKFIIPTHSVKLFFTEQLIRVTAAIISDISDVVSLPSCSKDV